MSCDHELANEWVRCSGENVSYTPADFSHLDMRTYAGAKDYPLLSIHVPRAHRHYLAPQKYRY